MKHYKLNAPARQAGLTLLELTVVMTILIALGGLMVPYVSSFFGTTQDSTSVSSLAEVDKWMQGYYTKSRKEPNNMEALINGVTGTVALTSTTVPPGCNTSTLAPNAYSPTLNDVYCNMIFPGYFNPIPLTSTLLSSTGTPLWNSLQMAGITSLYYNDPNTVDATFASTLISSSTSVQPVALSTSSYVAQVVIPSNWTPPTSTSTTSTGTPTIEDYLADVFGTTASKFDGQRCYDYIAFGIGNQSALTGTVMATAPVHFNADGTSGPVLKYNRYVVIYQVDANNNAESQYPTGLNPLVLTKGCPAGIESAKYIGTVIAGNQSDTRLMGLARTQGTAYEKINNNGN